MVAFDCPEIALLKRNGRRMLIHPFCLRRRVALVITPRDQHSTDARIGFIAVRR